MHKVFGEKKDTEYVDRKGAYLIAVQDGKVAVVKTPKGFFFLGGGIESGEKDEEAITRECREEVGYSVVVERFVCSAETYGDGTHPVWGYFHPIQKYYAGKLLELVCEPIEQDHQLVWMEYDELRGKMVLPMQNWALEQFGENYNRQ